MSQAIRDVVVRVKIEQDLTKKLVVPGAQQAAAQVRTVQKAVDDTSKSYLQLGGAAKQAGAGVIALARGYAFLTAAKEEDIKKSAQNIAALEGIIHTGSGVIDIITGTVNAYKALKGSAAAATVANGALAVSQRAVGAASVAAAGAKGAGGLSSIATSTLAVVSSFAALKSAGASVATYIGSTLTGAAAALAGKFALVAGAGIALGEVLSRTFGGEGTASVGMQAFKEWRAASADAERIEKASSSRDKTIVQAGEIDDRRTAAFNFSQSNINAGNAGQDALRQLNIGASARAGSLAGMAGINRRRQAALRGMTGASSLADFGRGQLAFSGAQQMAQEQGQRDQFREPLAQAEGAREAAVKRLAEAEERLNDAKKHGANEIAAATSAQLSALEAVKTAEEGRLSVLKDQNLTLRSNRDQAEGALATAKQALLTERQANESAAAKFGRLDKGTQQRVLGINAKIQSGQELSEAEARELDRIGLGGNAADKVFAKRGTSAGFGNLDESLTGRDQGRAGMLEQQVSARQSYVNELNAQIQSSEKTISQDMRATITAISGWMAGTKAEIRALRDAMENAANRQKAAAR